MVIYNVQTNGACNQLVIELISDTIYIDTSLVAYVTGNINLNIPRDPRKSVKAYLIGKSFFKAKFQGTGKVYLHATLGNYHKFGLKDNEDLIINHRAFVVCRDAIDISPHYDYSLKNFLTGVPMVNMLAKGTGAIMVLMPGPVQEIQLKEDKFVAFGNEVAAYTTQLKISREVVGDNWPANQRMARVFRGTGSVFFCPIPNKGSKSRSAR